MRHATPPTIHYGWVIAGTGTLIIFACLGLGRFALGMLLPSMGASLAIDYTQMGFISTGNFTGYLSAVLVSGLMAARLGERRLIVAGLALVAVSMVAVSQSQGFHSVLFFYVLTGFGAGVANIPMMALVAHWFSRSLRGRAAGFIVSGSGLAIVFSGWTIPLINHQLGSDGWRWSWLLLGVLVSVIALVALILLRNRPAQMGLRPLGIAPHSSDSHQQDTDRASALPIIVHLGSIYFTFGFTYVIYATFIVTTLVQERGFSEALAGQFWMWVGIVSIFSGPLFGTLSDRLGRKPALMMVFMLHTLAYLLIALPLPGNFTYLSIFLWGIGVWSIPSIIAAAVGDYLGADRAAAAFGTVTLFFGIGQIAGPGIAGLLADFTQSFSWSFVMAAGVTLLGLLLSSLLRHPEKEKKDR
ncbi:MAG: MFS transporter [Gammaproteobacteria bacterium]|nr:MFS transporter [Gammaproteobacteria bacterium]